MASGFPPQGTASGSEYAGLGARIGAHIIDALLATVGALPGIIIALIAGIGAGAGNMSDSGSTVASIAGVIGAVIAGLGALIVALYNIYRLGSTGQSIGRKIMKIKVLNAEGQPIGFGKAFLRELVKGIVGGACLFCIFGQLGIRKNRGFRIKPSVRTSMSPDFQIAGLSSN